MSVAIVTFGCRVNQADSQALDAGLRRTWGAPADPELADLVVVNTCAVTAGAEQSARQVIRRVARLNPRARIVATGCYATRNRAEVAALAGVSAVWSNAEKNRLIEDAAGAGDQPEPGVLRRTVRFLRIQTGCEARCAYCAIPATRGPSRSLDPSRVEAAVAAACARGFREVVLTGVHLGAYGRDVVPRTTLAELVRRLDAGRPGTRLRLSAIEPMDCGPDLAEFVVGARRFVPHLHLPLQSGSDRVLERMRRPYDAAGWERLIQSVRRRAPDAGLGTDLIAGFPGETEADFEATLDLLQRSGLSYVHVFPYSARPGTDAAVMPGRVPADVIRRRVTALRTAGEGLRRAFEQSQIGTVRDALTLQDPEIALTDNYLKVRIPAGRPSNERVAVRLTAAAPLAGEVVSRRAATPVAGPAMSSRPRR